MIGFIGGTGSQGKALALRIAASGEEVIIGSRSKDKAEKAVESIRKRGKNLRIEFGTNEDVAERADLVFFTLPYSAMMDTANSLKVNLKGKTVVDVINPIDSGTGQLGVSVSEALQSILTEAKVVCAFKNVSSELMWDIDQEIEVDSIVCSDFSDAKRRVMEFSEKMGINSVDGGGLENSIASEILTKILLNLNKKKKTQTGIKFLSFPV